MDSTIEYDSDYILDRETEIPEFGFHVIVEGKGLFQDINCKIRCFMALRRLVACDGRTIYAICCLDDSLHMLIGNCTLYSIQTCMRSFKANYSMFVYHLLLDPPESNVRIRFVTSIRDFKSAFTDICVCRQTDFSDCITYMWSSFRYYVGAKWEFGNMICRKPVLEAFGCKKCNMKFIKAVLFNERYIYDADIIKKFYTRPEPVTKEEKSHIIISNAFTEYFNIPSECFYYFPDLREKLILELLNQECFFDMLVMALRASGNTYREIGELLHCSYTKIYCKLKSNEKLAEICKI